MNKQQQTYKASGYGLAIAFLLLFTCFINGCKTLQPAAKKTSEAAKSVPLASVPVTPEAPAPVVKKETTVKTDSAKTAVASPVTGQTVTSSLQDTSNAVAAPAVKDSSLKLTAKQDETELKELEKQFVSDVVAVTGADQKVPDTSIKLAPAAEKAKLQDNTGSNYFNGEQQANMNDQLKSVYTTKLLYDSVTANSNKDFIYNTLTVNNTTANKIEIQVVIASSPGWQMVTTNIVNLTLDPFGSSIIPMRFTPSGNNTAHWQQVRIEYRLNNVVDTRKTFFKIRVQEYSSFRATLPNSSKVLTGYQKNNSFPVFVKNAGNTEGVYGVSINNQLLKLESNFDIRLAPGKDTTMYIPVVLSESQFAMLKKEDIRVAVANDKKETINLIQGFSKVGYILKDHPSAFLDMPLQFEVGAMYQGEGDPLQYYGALYGSLDLTDQDHIAMSLRSNTIAQGQTNNNSIVRFDYNGRHISASVGNIQGAGEFLVDGYGARIGYEWKDNNKAEVYAMLKSRTGDAKVGGAAVQIGIKDRVRIYDALSLSQDNTRERNSGILNQITEYKFNNGKFALITGVGAEKNTGTLAENTSSTLIGSSLGYNFQWITKRLAATSNILYNSNSYPGTFKGQRLQNHDLRVLFDNNFIGGYYEYNYRKQTYWLDTLLFSDVFNIKTTNYGLRGGVSLKGMSIMLAAGNQRQEQEGDNAIQTNYNYLNLNLSAVLFKNLFVSLNSFGGDLSAVGESRKHVFVSTTQGNIQFKTFGASFRYDNGPYYYQEYTTYQEKPQVYERIIFSPFVELHLLKKTLNARIQANYAKTLPADVTTTNMLANVSYSTRDYDFNINGIVPLDGGGNKAYLNAAVRMRIKAPFVAVRKYYNLKLMLFKDENGNGKRDVTEEPIAGQTLSLNGDLFVSDGDGLVIYKNTEKGAYKADFGYSSKLKGWIPNEGSIQYYEVNGNTSINVPYKVSRVLSGKLMVEKDALSNLSFNPGNIKVTATGDKGEVYSTLTDENGDFYFNLPAGSYIVTLSEVAFGDQFKPVQFSQPADLLNNMTKSLYFEIKQKKRQINIKKK